MKRIFLGLTLTVIVFTGIALAQGGVKKKRVPVFEYGNVTLNNFSGKAGLYNRLLISAS